MGDIKSHGFCAAPGAEHPSGRMYKLDRPAQPAHWGADWGRLLDEAWAARGRSTSGHGGGSDGGEGDGRNCELYDLKKQLFHQQGIDEDDPEMAERILAANAEFAVPLRESEIWNTILKIKGWRRHGPLGTGLAVSEEDQELAEAKARVLAAFSPEGISAGRGVFGAMKRISSSLAPNNLLSWAFALSLPSLRICAASAGPSWTSTSCPRTGWARNMRGTPMSGPSPRRSTARRSSAIRSRTRYGRS